MLNKDFSNPSELVLVISEIEEKISENRSTKTELSELNVSGKSSLESARLQNECERIIESQQLLVDDLMQLLKRIVKFH